MWNFQLTTIYQQQEDETLWATAAWHTDSRIVVYRIRNTGDHGPNVQLIIGSAVAGRVTRSEAATAWLADLIYFVHHSSDEMSVGMGCARRLSPWPAMPAIEHILHVNKGPNTSNREARASVELT